MKPQKYKVSENKPIFKKISKRCRKGFDKP